MKDKKTKIDCLVNNIEMLEIPNIDLKNDKGGKNQGPGTENDNLAQDIHFETIDADVLKNILDIKPHRPSKHVDPDWESESSCEDPFDPPRGGLMMDESMYEDIEDDSAEESEVGESKDTMEDETAEETTQRDFTRPHIEHTEYLKQLSTEQELEIDLEEIIERRKAYEKEEDDWYASHKSMEFMDASGLIEEMWKEPDSNWNRWVLLEETSDLNQRIGKKLDIPIEPEVTREEMSESERKCHDTITKLITEIRESQQAYKAVRSLYEFHKANPKVKLRPYMVDMDYFLVRYVVWGLNFYAAKDESKPIDMKESDVILEEYTTTQMKKASDHKFTLQKKEVSLFTKVTLYFFTKLFRAWARFWHWIIPHD